MMWRLSSPAIAFRSIFSSHVRLKPRRTNKVAPALGIAFALYLAMVQGFAQVGPAEIADPRLKAVEQAHLKQLVDVSLAIDKWRFPFAFKLSRYAGLDPAQQSDSDARGLEFVTFHDHLVLKITGNYNAAYNAVLLTPNQRAGRVFADVVLPVLGLLPNHIASASDFDAIGLEIAYHTAQRNNSYAYEGKEILTLVFNASDALDFAASPEDRKAQAMLDRSEIYLNGQQLGLALGERDPYFVGEVHRPASAPAHSDAPNLPKAVGREQQEARDHLPPAAPSDALPKTAFLMPAPRLQNTGASSSAPWHAEDAVVRPATAGLEEKYRAQLDAMAKEGAVKFHFVEYAPPSFVIVRNQPALQLTLRNPNSFDENSTSIYKRAARSFDLFLALMLKPILNLVPDSPECRMLDVTLLVNLVSGSGKSSEAIEFVFPLQELHQFAAADITNQELINRSVVLVNGVRIALNLQDVE